MTEKLFLVVKRNDLEVGRHPVSEGKMILGAGTTASVTLQDALVSPEHAELRVVNGRCLLFDLNSAGGTIVGQIRLIPGRPYRLALSDRVRIGPFEVWLEKQADEAQIAIKPTPDVETVPRIRYLAIGSPGRLSTWLQDLPAPFQENDLLGRFLNIFETIWEPLEQRQDHISLYFDPRTTPVELLTWVGGWIDAPFDEGWSEAARRRALKAASELFADRGTKHGLVTLIRVFTGFEAAIEEDPKEPYVFNISIHTGGKHAARLDHKLLEAVVTRFKPAACAFRLEIQ